jgi:GNAT superfamily N-acetyltransferase
MEARDITIRPGRAADARDIAAMANELNVFEGKPDGVYSEELVGAQAFGPAPLYSVLVAEVGGGLVGYAFFHDSYNSETAGRRLMAAVARATLARGVTSLWWAVLSRNHQARAFYAGLGAKDEDTRILELGGEALRRLADAAGE